MQIYVDGTWNDALGQLAGVGFIAEFDKETVSQKPSTNPSEKPDEELTASPSTTQNEDIVKGDVNGDEKIA